MQAKYEVYKKWGETPLECLERLRRAENIPANIPMTYAGRLDPAAEGQLIILTGEECKKKDEYTALLKTYEAEILFGISTDSYDLLGLPVYTCAQAISIEKIEEYLKKNLGKHIQKYPHYSSKHIDTGVLPEPHEVELFEYEDVKIGKRTRDEILERVEKLTELVTGDFRQAEIKNAWQNLPGMTTLPAVSLTLRVSSGFYVRQFAEDLGNELGTSACLYSLVRTEIN